MKILVNGNIPKGARCPYVKECNFFNSQCPTAEKPNDKEYSCAAAREFEMIRIRMASSSVAVQKNDGEFCIECREFYPMAEKNHSKGLICWSCRSVHGWKYT